MAITTLFQTGWEHGLAGITSGGGLFTTVSQTTIQTATPRNGTYYGRIAAAAQFGRFAFTLPSGNRKVVSRIGFKIVSVTGTNKAYITTHELSASRFSAYCDGADGKIYVVCPAAGTPIAGPSVNDGAWHYMELQTDSAGATATADWKVDGIAQTQATGSITAADTTGVTAGINLSWTGTVEYDDWIVGSWSTAATDWYGDGKGIRILPGSDGTHSFVDNDFSTGDAGTQRAHTYASFYLMVDDSTAWTSTRDAADNIAQRVINSAGYVEIAPAATPETGTANSVRTLLARSSSATGANAAGCIIRNSAGTAVVLDGDLPVAQGGNGGALTDWSDTSSFFRGQIVTKPGAGWTPTEVNAVRWRFGGATDVIGIPTVDALMLEADYPTVVASTLILESGFVNFSDPGIY